MKKQYFLWFSLKFSLSETIRVNCRIFLVSFNNFFNSPWSTPQALCQPQWYSLPQTSCARNPNLWAYLVRETLSLSKLSIQASLMLSEIIASTSCSTEVENLRGSTREVERFKRKHQGGREFKRKHQGGRNLRGSTREVENLRGSTREVENLRGKHQGGREFKRKHQGGREFKRKHQGGREFKRKHKQVSKLYKRTRTRFEPSNGVYVKDQSEEVTRLGRVTKKIISESYKWFDKILQFLEKKIIIIT